MKGYTKKAMRIIWAAHTLSLQVRFRSKQRNPGFTFYRCRNTDHLKIIHFITCLV